MSDWPPKFKITPEGAAGLFLLSSGLGDHSSKDTQDRLAALFVEFHRQGTKDAEARVSALEAALQPFVRVNSSEETITIKVRTADITAALAQDIQDAIEAFFAGIRRDEAATLDAAIRQREFEDVPTSVDYDNDCAPD